MSGTDDPTAGRSGTGLEGRDRDRRSLEIRFEQMLRHWSAGDASAYAGLFAPDVTYVGFDGFAFRSREELRDSHHELFRGVLRGSRLVGSIEHVRFLSDDVAVLHCRGAVVTRGRGTAGRGRDSVQTLVAHRVDGDWTFTDFHNNRYRPLPRLVRWYMRRSAQRHPVAAS
jgi:uncharacterized protein (TIGR02246 family)